MTDLAWPVNWVLPLPTWVMRKVSHGMMMAEDGLVTWTKSLRGVGPMDVRESSESVFVFVLSSGFLMLGDPGLGLNTSSTRAPLIDSPPVDWPVRKMKQMNTFLRNTHT